MRIGDCSSAVFMNCLFFQFLGLLLSKNKSSKPDDTEDIAITEENLRRQEVHELRETNHTQKKLLERVLKEVS